MSKLADGLILIVALAHIYFLILEMFQWQKPKTLRIFNMTKEFAKSTAAMAANQGLYNGFLAAGLLWSFCAHNPVQATHIRVFFLVCIIIAGLYGAYSVTRRIFYVQAMPAILALLATLKGAL